ncbi:hypothetical protein BYT27DRAFT_7184272, partial [Phlegmacium glaucopus]
IVVQEISMGMRNTTTTYISLALLESLPSVPTTSTMDPNSHIWLYSPVIDRSQRPPVPPILTQHPQGPIHQDMGLIRNHHRRHLVTEAPSPYQILPESSRTITRDRSNGTHPSMGAIDNSGPGEARPPSRNPRMGNHGSNEQRRIEPYYNDDRSEPSQAHIQGETRGEEDLSTYEIPLIDFTGMLVLQSIHLLFTTLRSGHDRRRVE